MRLANLKIEILSTLIVMLDAHECYGSIKALWSAMGHEGDPDTEFQTAVDDLVNLGYVFKMTRGVVGRKTSLLSSAGVDATSNLKFPTYNITQAGRNALALHRSAVS